jgi:hypothetical protein
LRRRGTTKGIRLIDFQSLLDYINSKVEPAYVPEKPPQPGAAQIQQPAFVQKLGLNEPLRIIISMRVEKEPETLAQGTNVSPQRLRDPVG